MDRMYQSHAELVDDNYVFTVSLWLIESERDIQQLSSFSLELNDRNQHVHLDDIIQDVKT